LKKIAASVAAAAMLAAVPAFADQTSRAAPVTDGFLTIGGPKRLVARGVLKVPIRCSVECSTTAKTSLRLPDTSIPPDKVDGHLTAGHARKLVVSLNDAATESIQAHPNASRMKVDVSAVSDDSDAKVHAVKVFRFTSP
jgi:hypothetical protein